MRLGDESSIEKIVSAGEERIARAEDAQPRRRRQQPELDRIPIEPREIGELAARQRPQSTLAIGLQKARIDRIREQWDMAEYVVKDIRLLQIVERLLRADEGAGGKAPIGEMLEENIVRHEAGDRNDAPAGQRREPRAQRVEIGNAVRRQLQRVHREEIFVAGAAGQQRGLAGVEPAPAVVLGRAIGRPILVDRPIGAAWRVGVAVLVSLHAALLGKAGPHQR